MVYGPDRDTFKKAKLYSFQKIILQVSIALQEVITLCFTTICISLLLEWAVWKKWKSNNQRGGDVQNHMLVKIWKSPPPVEWEWLVQKDNCGFRLRASLFPDVFVGPAVWRCDAHLWGHGIITVIVKTFTLLLKWQLNSGYKLNEDEPGHMYHFPFL